jgi:hypothetical protein
MIHTYRDKKVVGVFVRFRYAINTILLVGIRFVQKIWFYQITLTELQDANAKEVK